MSEPRRLVEVFTFEVVNSMVIDDLGKLIREAEERAKAAQIAAEPQPKPTTETPTRTVLGLLGGRASGWF